MDFPLQSMCIYIFIIEVIYSSMSSNNYGSIQYIAYVGYALVSSLALILDSSENSVSFGPCVFFHLLCFSVIPLTLK